MHGAVPVGMAGERGEAIREAARVLVAADTAIAVTGAGVSTESGIPDFRGEDGIWEQYDQADFTVQRFHSDPGGFWTDWLGLRADLIPPSVEPNDAHRALADLERAGHLDAVITQNVDGLHQAAGSERVIELHGSGDRAVCRGCGESVPAAVAAELARESSPPRCEDCGDVLKPGAVLFGERLPPVALAEARGFARDCGACLVVGSSLTVHPAASLPRQAVGAGADLVVVNADRTPVDDDAAHTFRDPAGQVLPHLADAAGEREP